MPVVMQRLGRYGLHLLPDVYAQYVVSHQLCCQRQREAPRPCIERRQLEGWRGLQGMIPLASSCICAFVLVSSTAVYLTLHCVALACAYNNAMLCISVGEDCEQGSSDKAGKRCNVRRTTSYVYCNWACSISKDVLP